MEPATDHPTGAERVDTDALQRRLGELERRLAAAEDRLALLQLVASYGPAVDSGSAAETARLWTENGVYDTYPKVLEGRAAIEGMVTGGCTSRSSTAVRLTCWACRTSRSTATRPWSRTTPSWY